MTTDTRDETCGNCGHDDPHPYFCGNTMGRDTTKEPGCCCTATEKENASLKARIERLTNRHVSTDGRLGDDDLIGLAQWHDNQARLAMEDPDEYDITVEQARDHRLTADALTELRALRAEVERLTTIIETLRNRVPTEVDHVEEMAAHNAAVAQIGGE